ncbi:isochorismatase [Burkholderia ubonensis]|uniref:Isochorismatase n=1 Tax=Burkholderia ubonensis TaxID=101571 RepID=A0AB73G883_9BURK|nr:isochorismatase family cysteine hydrolase [Burkholderia ubonensis]KVK86521.1 isochorismatase [Burkholderia ubonensis]KVL71267.1 isochorismatase [Burkholderia ubonensis]KVM35951.1 isochorismatase [Burkholderia ubonensis]KVM40021.1 isochorismatase [Burkholderia ubonensis]KWO24013.1 isochorismatase [Burkholderia ubonensis]
MNALGDTFDPRRAALLIIDMQRDFVDPGAPIACVGAPDVVPAITRLAQSARAAGMPVIYTQEAHRRQKVDFGLELEYGETEHCVEGTPGVEIVDALAPAASDYVLVKRRYSGFFATDLDLLLKGLRVDTLVLTGVATDVCVRATAQDALQLDYRVFVPRECVAGTTAARHDAALEHVGYVLGRVVSLDALIARLAPSAGAVHA